jgi:hypothetical protein
MTAFATARLRPPVPAEHDDPRLTALREDVSRRIARVCAAMPADEFASLVEQIARFEQRWELRERRWPRAATERRG